MASTAMDIADSDDGDEDAAFVSSTTAIASQWQKRRKVGVGDDDAVVAGGGDVAIVGEAVDLMKVAVVAGDAPAVDVGSGSESTSCSSSSGSGSRARYARAAARLQQRAGAAAAAAVLSAAAPLDVDEDDRVCEREVVLPTDFALRLQHEGDLVALMADTGTVISARPGTAGSTTGLHIAGRTTGTARAAWQLEQLHRDHVAQEELSTKMAAEEAVTARLEQLEIPSALMSRIMGANGKGLEEVREKCGGIMIALQPPSVSGGPLIAFIGPGQREYVLLAKRELTRRLNGEASPRRPHEAAAAPPAPVSPAVLAARPARQHEAAAAAPKAPAEEPLLKDFAGPSAQGSVLVPIAAPAEVVWRPPALGVELASGPPKSFGPTPSAVAAPLVAPALATPTAEAPAPASKQQPSMVFV